MHIMRLLLCAVLLISPAIYAAERLSAAAGKRPCGEEHAVKQDIGRKALGLPGAAERRFSKLALSVSSIGIPQARCEAEPVSQRVQPTAPACSCDGTLGVLCDPEQSVAEHARR